MKHGLTVSKAPQHPKLGERLTDAKAPKYAEIVHFKMFIMPCCSHNPCWLNPRLPNYCPECGAAVYSKLRFDPEKYVAVDDPEALLKSSSGVKVRW